MQHPQLVFFSILEKTIREELLHRMIAADQKKSLEKKQRGVTAVTPPQFRTFGRVRQLFSHQQAGTLAERRAQTQPVA